MGNRAVITCSKAKDVAKSNDIGIYLHWNGGRDSVNAFLTYCKIKGYRAPEKDDYGWACLATVIGNFFGDGLSIGINNCCNLDCDNYDNGVYIIENWEIVGRQYYDFVTEQSNYDLLELLIDIDSCMPVSAQLGAEEIKKRLIELN